MPTIAIPPFSTATFPGEPPEHRVVLEQVGEGRGVNEVVDGHDLDVGVLLVGRAQEAAPYPAESVDGNSY